VAAAARTLGEPGDIADVALSPDGARVASSLLDDRQQTRSLWLYDVTRGIGTPLTTDPDEEFAPCVVARRNANRLQRAAQGKHRYLPEAREWNRR
jgi:hypothetical protein